MRFGHNLRANKCCWRAFDRPRILPRCSTLFMLYPGTNLTPSRLCMLSRVIVVQCPANITTGSDVRNGCPCKIGSDVIFPVVQARDPPGTSKAWFGTCPAPCSSFTHSSCLVPRSNIARVPYQRPSWEPWSPNSFDVALVLGPHGRFAYKVEDTGSRRSLTSFSIDPDTATLT